MNKITVSYVTTLPKEANAPRVSITGNFQETYRVLFYDITNGIANKILISSGLCNANQTIVAGARQWFTKWYIEVKDLMGVLVFNDTLELFGKTVFIKLDAYALGDTIAWIPYVDAFRVHHKCSVICSTFHNYLLVESYPDLMFVKPNTVIENVYAQYYIGAATDGDARYSPVKADEVPLQTVASAILGLPHVELMPDLSSKYVNIPPRTKNKYVTLSEYGSSDIKHWKAAGGWQRIVDFLKTCGYEVLVISKEKTNLRGIIDLTGDISLDMRCVDIKHAAMHLGVSSGLSWLAWSLGTHVLMISDVTPNWHEFQTNITRVNANDLTKINYSVEGQSTIEEVMKKLSLSIGL